MSMRSGMVMIAPDEYVIRLFDQAVLWLHNWGIKRVWLTRATCVALALGGSTCTFIKHNQTDYFQPMLLAVIVVVIGGLVELAERLSDTKSNNLRRMAYREGIQGWMRFSVILLDAWVLFDKFPWNLDSLLWMLWLWVPMTYTPPDPPKHSLKDKLRELFSPKTVPVPA